MAAAVICCLDTSLWKNTLDGRPGVSYGKWRVVGIFREVADELFLAWCPGWPMVSRMNGTKLTCGYRSNLIFSALLAIRPERVLAAAMRAGLLEKGETMATSRYVVEPLYLKTAHARVFHLSVHRTSESWTAYTLVPLCVYHVVVVDMFFVCGSCVTGYSGHKTKTTKL